MLGEGGEDEMVLPLKSGIGVLVDALVNELQNRPLQGIAAPATASTVPFQRRQRHSHAPAASAVHNWNIGVLVADERGIKELERRQAKYRISESQRRGY